VTALNATNISSKSYSLEGGKKKKGLVIRTKKYMKQAEYSRSQILDTKIALL